MIEYLPSPPKHPSWPLNGVHFDSVLPNMPSPPPPSPQREAPAGAGGRGSIPDHVTPKT